MQTFLPLPDFKASAKVLDRRRLGKQRLEVLQILSALAGRTTGWVNSPATRMWRGYEVALIKYGVIVCFEWRRRGYVDHMLPKIADHQSHFGRIDTDVVMPPWFGDDDFHLSHRSNLLRKAPEYYRQFWPNDPDGLEYVWPLEIWSS